MQEKDKDKRGYGAMLQEMERVNRILRHPLYQKYLRQNEEAEQGRVFCHHDMIHFTDVARITQILNLEEETGLSVELIYAAALLHDIGRFQQYADKTPHEKASAELSLQILKECGFDNSETDVIIDAILHHRDKTVQTEKNLRGLLYRADKLSRPCYACKAQTQCDWSKEKKNLAIVR